MKKITIISTAIATVLCLNLSVFAECYIAEGNGCQSYNRCSGLFAKGDKCTASLHGSTVGTPTCAIGVAPAMGVTCGDRLIKGPAGPCTKGDANGCGGPYPAPCP